MKQARTTAMDLLYDLVGSVLYATSIYIFAKTANFAPGGISGLALIMNHLWKLPIGGMTLVLNIPLVLFSYRFVGKRFLLKTLRSMMISTIVLDVVFPFFPSYTGSSLLAALYSGVFLGAGLAVFYMRGSSSGGMDFLIISIKKLKPHLSIGSVTMALDMVIILLGWPVFGSVDAVLYGLINIGVSSVVMDKILYGMGVGKLLLIITSRGQEVADYIAEKSDRGSTMIRAIGTYTGSERQVLLCACSKPEAYKIRSAAYKIDAGCFVMIAETNEVYGEGFSDPENDSAF